MGASLRLLAQRSHHAKMGKNGFTHRKVLVVAYVEFGTSLFYDAAYVWIVYMTYTGKQVMLHLVIEPSHQPGNN